MAASIDQYSTPTPTPAARAEGTGRAWPRVDVVLLGWRAAETTCAALAGLATCGYPALRVIVVDNGSDDGADDVVWAELQRLHADAVRIPRDALDALAAAPRESGAGAGVADAVLVTSPRNRGYAGGMNLGLAYLRAVQPGDYFLLLNNDVLVGPGVLEALVERCEADPTIGLCGPTQLVHDERGEVSSTVPCGFRYHPIIGFSAQIDFDAGTELRAAEVEQQMYGVLGGAVFGTAAYLRATGLLNAESFIYFEEEEMAHSARQAGFRIAWAPAAQLSNIHSGTMLTNGIASRERVPMVRYLMARGRFRFTLRHYRRYLPTVVMAQLVHCSYDLARGNFAETWAAILGAYDAFRNQHRRFPGLGQAELPGRVIEGRAAPLGRRLGLRRPGASATGAAGAG